MSEHEKYKCTESVNGVKKYYYNGKPIKKDDIPKRILPSLICSQKEKAVVSERVRGFEESEKKKDKDKRSPSKGPRKVGKASPNRVKNNRGGPKKKDVETSGEDESTSEDVRKPTPKTSATRRGKKKETEIVNEKEGKRSPSRGRGKKKETEAVNEKEGKRSPSKGPRGKKKETEVVNEKEGKKSPVRGRGKKETEVTGGRGRKEAEGGARGKRGAGKAKSPSRSPSRSRKSREHEGGEEAGVTLSISYTVTFMHNNGTLYRKNVTGTYLDEMVRNINEYFSNYNKHQKYKVEADLSGRGIIFKVSPPINMSDQDEAWNAFISIITGIRTELSEGNRTKAWLDESYDFYAYIGFLPASINYQ